MVLFEANQQGYQIHYVPELTVFHHRRQGIWIIFSSFWLWTSFCIKAGSKFTVVEVFHSTRTSPFHGLNSDLLLVDVTGNLAAYVILIGWTCYGLAIFKALLDIALVNCYRRGQHSLDLPDPSCLWLRLSYWIHIPKPTTKLR